MMHHSPADDEVATTLIGWKVIIQSGSLAGSVAPVRVGSVLGIRKRCSTAHNTSLMEKKMEGHWSKYANRLI